MIPPSYLDLSGKAHTGGTKLQKPPLCNRCTDLPDTGVKLEQHVAVMNLPMASSVASKPVNWTTPRVSLFKPLQIEDKPIYEDLPTPLDAVRQKPSWMSLLPSNRNPHLHPPRDSALQRRSSFPHFSSTRFSSPFSTPAEKPATEDRNGQPVPAPTSIALPDSLPAVLSRRCPGQWPSSSHSCSCSESGSDVTVGGAVVVNDYTSGKHSPALMEPQLSAGNAMLHERASPLGQTSEENQTVYSSSVSSLLSSNLVIPIKWRKSGLGDVDPLRPGKLRKPSMADCIPEIPAAARHRSACCKDFSSLVVGRDDRIALPSGSIDRCHDHGNGLAQQQSGRRSSSTLIENGTFNGKLNVQKGLQKRSSERLNRLAGKMMAMVSAGSDGRGLGTLCKACRECPCRPGATSSLRRRLFKASK